MRITAPSETMRSINRVHEKQDTDAHSRQQGHQEQGRKEQELPYETVSEQKVVAAIEAFGGDSENRAAGLRAEMAGMGPGLRVVLKDGTGAIVRQFTGEEFLRVREAALTDGRVRGKILDQKL